MLMRVTDRTIKAITRVLLGDDGRTPERDLKAFKRMYNDFAVFRRSPSNHDQIAKREYIEEILLQLNEAGKITDVILEVISPVYYKNNGHHQSSAVDVINHGLLIDEHLLKKDINGTWYIENVGEPDWEDGSEESFLHELAYRSDSESLNLPDDYMIDLTKELRDIHSQEQGMNHQFHDLAYQHWIATFITAALKKAKNGTFENIPNEQIPVVQINRQNIILQTQTLVSALEENLEAVRSRTNHPPTLDLALHEKPDFEVEISELTIVLRSLQKEFESKKNEVVKPSLASEGLREFVLKLCGSAGTGIGKSIAVATQLALAYCAINILKELGMPVNDLYQKASLLITKG